MDEQDIAEIESAGRRCAVCHTGRHWRRFVVVRAEGRAPVVLCPACHARYGDRPPVKGDEPAPAPVAAKPAPARNGGAASGARAAAESSRTGAGARNAAAGRSRSADGTDGKTPAQHEDRLRKALRELPRGEHSTGRIAKAAGLNHAKALHRLHALEKAGEVRQVGKRWSTERPSTDIEAAFDRLAAKTGNLRIVRERDHRN